MSKTPTAPGYFWGKLIEPYKQPEGEDWKMTHPEIVMVDENYGDGEDELRVYVPGVGTGQLISGFEWGGWVADLSHPIPK